MKKFLSIVSIGALVCALSFSQTSYAQVGVSVGAGASGSVGSGTSANANTDASADLDEGTSNDTADTDNAGSGSSGSISTTGASFSFTQKDAASASLDAESAELGSASVSTTEDLSHYATAQMKHDTRIESIDVSSERVRLAYRKDARFLGFIPSSIRATATVSSDGDVSVDYPWYRFLFAVTGDADAEATLEARAHDALASANSGFTASIEATIIDAIRASLADSLATTSDRATTADEAGESAASADSSNTSGGAGASGAASGGASGSAGSGY